MKYIFFLLLALCTKSFAQYIPYENTPYGHTAPSINQNFSPPEVVPMNFSSSWSVPRSILGADANPLNALPSNVGGKSALGNAHLLTYNL